MTPDTHQIVVKFQPFFNARPRESSDGCLKAESLAIKGFPGGVLTLRREKI